MRLVYSGMIGFNLDRGGLGNIRLRRMGFILGMIAHFYANINGEWG